MLISKKKNEKDYYSMMEEVYSEIPIYTEEWTNYNASDPGITMLENLTAFNAVQMESLKETSEQVKLKLLKMAGFEPEKSAGAKVLLAPRGLTDTTTLSANQRFLLGDISFETNKEKTIHACKLTGVFVKHNGKLKDYSYILDPEINIGATVFGKHPKVGDEIYFVMDSLPEPFTENIFYMEVSKSDDRNPLGAKERHRFAKIEWTCYTEAGFVPMNVKDETDGFIVNGKIHFRTPEEKTIVYSDGEINGYVFRGTLCKADYDRVPKIDTLTGFLFEVNQKETKAIAYNFSKSASVIVHSNLMEQGFYRVFCKEDKDSGYELYEEIGEEFPREGRFYTVKNLGNGYFEINFDKKKYGFSPTRIKNSVKVVVYDRDMMAKYYVGEVYGYDNQTLQLPVNNIISEAFSLLAVRTDDDGNMLYDFVKPNRMGVDDFSYEILETEGIIKINEPADFIGAKLYIASIAITSGTDGNVQAWNKFEPVGDIKGIADFVNPCAGQGGRFKETFEELRRRYVKDLYRPYAAVTASDYENWVKETPGLCIHKVKAYFNSENNTVEVVVKPNTLEDRPKMSQDYIKIITARLEQCRLLSTKVVLKQPVYLPVEVKGTIYIKRQYKEAREQIEKIITDELDYIHGNQQFGETVEFDKLIRRIEQLDAVNQVYDLAIYPQNVTLGKKIGLNVEPISNCLCYPGDYHLEILCNE